MLTPVAAPQRALWWKWRSSKFTYYCHNVCYLTRASPRAEHGAARRRKCVGKSGLLWENQHNPNPKWISYFVNIPSEIQDLSSRNDGANLAE